MSNIPIISVLYQLYSSFHKLLYDFPKTERYSLGQAVQSEILNILRNCLHAAGANAKQAERKQAYLAAASADVDTLRLLLCLCKDCRCIPNTAYQEMDGKAQEVGKMLGGWIKSIQSRPLPRPNSP